MTRQDSLLDNLVELSQRIFGGNREAAPEAIPASTQMESVTEEGDGAGAALVGEAGSQPASAADQDPPRDSPPPGEVPPLVPPDQAGSSAHPGRVDTAERALAC